MKKSWRKRGGVNFGYLFLWEKKWGPHSNISLFKKGGITGISVLLGEALGKKGINRRAMRVRPGLLSSESPSSGKRLRPTKKFSNLHSPGGGELGS